VRGFGFSLEAVGDGECTVRVAFTRRQERPGGIVSGPVFMVAADVAMWLAILTKLGLDDPSVTSHMTTAFVGAARREGFRCRARILRLGRRMIYGEARCVGRGGRLLAHHTVTYVRRDSWPPAWARPRRS
jgi:uncharacterized protein (TIGR00369 family)